MTATTRPFQSHSATAIHGRNWLPTDSILPAKRAISPCSWSVALAISHRLSIGLESLERLCIAAVTAAAAISAVRWFLRRSGRACASWRIKVPVTDLVCNCLCLFPFVYHHINNSLGTAPMTRGQTIGDNSQLSRRLDITSGLMRMLLGLIGRFVSSWYQYAYWIEHLRVSKATCMCQLTEGMRFLIETK